MTISATGESKKTFIPFRPGELRALERRDKAPVSQWASKHRIVFKSSMPGKWDNRVTPYLVGIMDTFCLPYVREIVIAKGVQAGGTEAAYNCLGWWLDRSCGNALVVMADEKSVKRLSKGRIIPMLQKTPRLASILSPSPDDTTIYLVQFRTGASLHIGWATSQAAVASDPCELVILDEIDKYASGINLEEAKRRVTTYPYTSKIIALSTPGIPRGPVWRELESCDEIRDYHVPCPLCGEFQIMTWDGFRWPQQEALVAGGEEPAADPRDIRRLNLAWYECRGCGGRWDDNRRNQAVADGQWVARIPVERPVKIGFHLPAWLSRFVSLSQVVSQRMEAANDHARLRMWHNTMAAEPFDFTEMAEVHHLDERLHARREQYAPEGAEWQIPNGALILFAAVDVQDNRLEAEIIAFGRGFESWGIEYKVFPGSPSRAELWEDLEKWLSREFLHESGHKLRIAACAIDTGGHHTREAYYFIFNRRGRRMPQYMPVKGSSVHNASLFKFTDAKQRKSKIPVMSIGTDGAKDTWSGWLQEELPGPGYVHIPVSYDIAWCRMVTAERAVIVRDRHGREKRVWEKRHPSARNEALDIRVYALAVATWVNPDWSLLENKYSMKPNEIIKRPARPIYSHGFEVEK